MELFTSVFCFQPLKPKVWWFMFSSEQLFNSNNESIKGVRFIYINIIELFVDQIFVVISRW
jgi:hypothetical protein